MLKAVIFDMDGTLVDTEPVYYVAAGDIFEQLGFTLTPEEYAQFTGRSLVSMWSFLREKFEITQDLDSLIDETKKGYLTKIREEKGLVPMPGVVDLIQSLRGKDLGMAVGTSTSRDLMKVTLDLFGLSQYFPVMVSASDVESGKPSPDIFLRAAELMKVEPEDCLVFEDSFHGSLAAKRAGMKCVGYTQNNHNYQDLSNADLRLADFGKVTIERLEQLFE
jgi:HAD superfamily hydrolase (TIGR01509 family)